MMLPVSAVLGLSYVDVFLPDHLSSACWCLLLYAAVLQERKAQ
jgi:hypothetical protein